MIALKVDIYSLSFLLLATNQPFVLSSYKCCLTKIVLIEIGIILKKKYFFLGTLVVVMKGATGTY